jgi:hypothetical protein
LRPRRAGWGETRSEAKAAIGGAKAKHVLPLGFAAKQCRDLAADLVDAANKLDGGKGWQN